MPRTLARNVLIALLVGTALALARGEVRLIAGNALLALWFSLGGHYVELLFLNGLRHVVPSAASVQRSARLVVWFAGGALLYRLMLATARLLSLGAPSADFWWLGGLAFTALELCVHVALALRAAPNFYRGDG